MSATLQPAKQAPTTGAGVPTIWLDGKWFDRETAMVSVYDHGLLYGDGVFEGIRIYGGRIFRLAEHLERLYDSAQAIWMTIPMPREELAAVTEEAVRRSGIAEGYIRHIVTRGVVIELARGAGYEVRETMLNRYDVYTADEAFFTGTAAEVVAIRQVDGRLIGAGKSGPITRDLRARFQALVRS
jgi:branched-subunit amino acid aminotransferase/4-amino-4-deoxychorismate lyase